MITQALRPAFTVTTTSKLGAPREHTFDNRPERVKTWGRVVGTFCPVVPHPKLSLLLVKTILFKLHHLLGCKRTSLRVSAVARLNLT